jgi:hypothetical protein
MFLVFYTLYSSIIYYMKKIEKNKITSGLARRVTPSAQARPGDRAGPARTRFTTCRVGFMPGFGPPGKSGPFGHL